MYNFTFYLTFKRFIFLIGCNNKMLEILKTIKIYCFNLSINYHSRI